MKISVFSALCAAAALSLAGCSTAHHKTEYKTYEAVVPGGYTGTNPLDEGLNRLSSEGWVVQSFSPKPGDSQRLIFLLKRSKH